MDKISTALRSSSDVLTVKTNFLLTLWKKLKIIQKKVSGNSGASLFELVVNVCFFLSTAGAPDRKLELLKVRLHFYDLFTVASPRPEASIPALKAAFALKSFS